MALNLRSNLKIKRGLIWEVKNPIPYQISASPEFFLFNSIWKFEINLLAGRDRETNDMFFNIYLKSLCELEPKQSFEIATFLEDKKNRVHMKCSQTTVSGKEMLIFSRSFFSLCKKIPGFCIQGDLFILFVFSSSADLGLNVTENKDKTSQLSITECLIWETRKPNVRNSNSVVSPAFTVMNSAWKLWLNAVDPNTAFHHAYLIYLRNTTGAKDLPEFAFKVFIDHMMEQPVQYECTNLQEASSAVDIYYKARYDSVFVDPPEFENVLDVTIVCVFIPCNGLSLNVEGRGGMAVLLDCSLCYNQGCFVHEKVPPGPESSRVPSMNFLPNLECLSDDFGEFIQKNILGDIKLKCRGDIISAHKAILAARSEVFLKKIQDEMNVNSNVIIDVSDIEPFILNLLLKYLYTGCIPHVLAEESVYKLYAVSMAYGVPSLQKMCRCYISKNLCEDNFVDMLIKAIAHGDNELKSAVTNFILQDTALLTTERWTRFTTDFPQIADEIHDKYVSKVLNKVSL